MSEFRYAANIRNVRPKNLYSEFDSTRRPVELLDGIMQLQLTPFDILIFIMMVLPDIFA